MKTSGIKTIFGILLIIAVASCEKDIKRDIPGFSIEFSDGTIIRENDILFYDSSTCIIFLKEKLNLIVGTGKSTKTFTKFKVYVDNDEIYGGIIYPNMLFNMAVHSPFISSRTYPEFESDFIEIYHYVDSANDYRIINCLNEKKLLKQGISCTIDSVYVDSYADSSVTCILTIQNHDDINYYIIDHEKMGIMDFSCYTSGLVLINSINSDYHSPTINYSSSGCNDLTLDDLSILEGNSKITYTYTSSYYPGFDKGTYFGQLRFQSMGYFRPITLSLDQENGRVWIGQIFVKKDEIVFN